MIETFYLYYYLFSVKCDSFYNLFIKKKKKKLVKYIFTKLTRINLIQII